MKDFGRVYRAEMYKNSRKKSLTKFVIACAVLLVLGFVSGAVMYKIGDVSDIFDLSEPFASNEEAIEFYETTIETVEAENDPLASAQLTKLRAQLQKYRYLQQEGMQSWQVVDFMSPSGKDPVSLVNIVMQFVMLAIAIYCIAAVSESVRGEYAKGILKMELVRPNDRNGVLAAKYCSVLSVAAIVYTVCFVISVLFGAIMFAGQAVKPVILMTADMGARAVSPFWALTVLYFGLLFSLVGVTFLALLLATSGKGKRSSLVLPILLYLLAPSIESLLCTVYTGYVGYVGFFNNLDFLRALSAEGAPCAGMNVIGMIALSSAWIAAMALISHKLFAKRDIG